MELWLAVVITGLLVTITGFIIFFKNKISLKNKNPVFIIGIFLPLILAYSYGEYFVFESAFNLTFIDLGALLVLGMISGIFIACYLLIDKPHKDIN